MDEAAAKLADNAAHRAAKTRLIKWKRFTVIQWHTHTQTKITQSKQKSRSRRRRKDLQSYYYHKHSHSYTATKQRKCYSSPFFTLQSHSFPARAALSCRCAAQLSIEMVCQTIQKKTENHNTKPRIVKFCPSQEKKTKKTILVKGVN